MVSPSQVGTKEKSAGRLYPLSQPTRSIQQKPVFRVLEDSALQDAQVSQSPISGEQQVLCTLGPRFDFSSPDADWLLLEFDLLCQDNLHKEPSSSVNNLNTKVPYELSDGILSTNPTINRVTPLLLGSSPLRSSRESTVRRVKGVAQFILSKVVSRTPVCFRPNEKSAPNHILFWMKETLECGHKQAVYPEEGETFTARRRSCHECLKEFVQAVEGKKPVQGIVRATKKKIAGNSVWPLAFAALLVLACVLWFRSHRPIGYTYAAPDDTFYVVDQFSDFDFLMQRTHLGVSQPMMTLHFCHDYMPLFKAGMTLTWFSFEDRGSCISIAPADRGYVIERGPDHWPIFN